MKTVVSQRKVAANRANARRSTGPRTGRGKARASRNALRHGLAAISLANSPALPQIERMAKAICGAGATPWQYELALGIAEAEYIVLVVRAARAAVVQEGCDAGGAGLEHAISQLTKLDRYERRALSRRQRAIRSLVAASILGAATPAARLPVVAKTKAENNQKGGRS